MAKIAHSNEGYTIVELLVTMIVAAIFLGSVGLYVSSHTHLGKRARDLTAINLYANNKIEALRSKGFLGITNGTTDITGELPVALTKSKSGTMTISSQSSALKKVEIKISYSVQGMQKTYTYITYIGELGVGQY